MNPGSIDPDPVRPRRLARPVAAVLAVLGGLVILPPTASTSTAAETEGGFRIVGKLPVLFEPGHDHYQRTYTGTLILDPAHRRLYQVIENGMTNAEPRWTVLQSFDLDTLKPGRRRRIDGLVPLRGRATYEDGSPMHAVDQDGARIFLAMADRVEYGNPTSADQQRNFTTVVEIDERRFDSDLPDAEVFAKRLSHPTPEHQALALNHGLKGMRYVGSRGRGALLMLWADWSTAQFSVAKTHQLVQWGVDRPTADSWTAPGLLAQACGRGNLNGANEANRTFYPLDVLPGPGYLAFACQKSEGSAQVLKVRLDSTGRPDASTIELHSLGRKYSDSIADVRGERLLLRSQISGQAWWVWDARASQWAGSVGVTMHDQAFHNAAGFDQETGRLYALVPDYPLPGGLGVAGGLGYSDTRLTPASQLQMHLPELAHPTVRRIEVDPAAPGRPRRLFVRRGSHDSTCHDIRTFGESRLCPAEPFWLVIEDHNPLPDAATANEVDRLTTDVDEQTGVTAANFGRSAAGFGARLRMLSGVSGAVTRDFDHQSTGISHRSACPPADRELVLGQVQSAQAGNVAASVKTASLYA
ncbi:MAG: hypothetical protein M3394_01840, partial [Actinomycetota bacterium]|nr:hypothetical protein [Actinomycetota bacterium]